MIFAFRNCRLVGLGGARNFLRALNLSLGQGNCLFFCFNVYIEDQTSVSIFRVSPVLIRWINHFSLRLQFVPYVISWLGRKPNPESMQPRDAISCIKLNIFQEFDPPPFFIVSVGSSTVAHIEIRFIGVVLQKRLPLGNIPKYLERMENSF